MAKEFKIVPMECESWTSLKEVRLAPALVDGWEIHTADPGHMRALLWRDAVEEVT